MELFIRIRDGQPFEHPILGENFRLAFPDVDTNNLPPEFARFERKEPTPVGVYEVDEGVTYELIDGVYTDVFHRRPMTDEEKLVKQEDTKAFWAQIGFASWVFDPITCDFSAPTPYPDDGKYYVWDEALLSWVEPQPPGEPT